MDVWMLPHDGAIVGQRTMPTRPEALRKPLAPYRAPLVIAVEGIVTGYWRADLCARERRPVVRGHALDMQALRRGNANKARIDTPKIAVLLRGGLLPQA